MKKYFVCVLYVFFFLVGCTSEYQMQIPVGEDGKLAESEEFKKRAATLPLVDREALAAYLIRASMAAAMTSMPMQPVTVSEAISAQRKFEAEQKAKADAEAVEQAKIAAEAKAIRDAEEAKVKRFKDMMTAYLASKDYTKANYRLGEYQDKIHMGVAFKNNTSKNIVGAKGSLEIFDSLGDRIMGLNISVESDIPASGQFLWEGSMDFNQFEPPHTKFVLAELERIQVTWVPSVVMFSDGTVERLE